MLMLALRSAVCAWVAISIAAAAPPKRYTIEQFMNTRQIGGASFSHDEKRILFNNNETGIYNAFTIPVGGGKPEQLTRSTKESTFGVEFFPKDSRFLYTYNQGGNELDHLFVRDAEGNERDLTPGEKGKAIFQRFHPDGKSFYFLWNTRDARFFDVYKLHTGTMEREKIFENSTGLAPSALSRDERWIVLVKTYTTNDSDIVLYNTATKETKNITEHKGNISNYPAAFDAQSRYLYYLTDAGHEFQYLARYQLATGKKEIVEKADWDIDFCYFSENGKYRVVGKNVDGSTQVTVYDQASGKAIGLPRIPAGDIRTLTFSRSETKMAFYVNGDRSPSALYAYDFAEGKLTKLVDGANPEIASEDLVEAETVRYKSFDGTAIPAMLYKPHTVRDTSPAAANRLPALVEVHGGPGGQSRKGYHGAYQFLVNQGYVILRVNNRGSSGYGKQFLAADDRKHGREPLLDCIEAKKYLKTLPYVDPDRIGIIGGSYGGYMTLAALAFHPTEFNVGVDIFGVSNWLRTLKNTPAWWESFRKALYAEMGDPAEDEVMLRAISPLFHADKIRRPLLVVQGANDPRVVKAESDEIVEAVKKNGIPVEYIVFPDEGHGFTKKANQITAYKGIADFLDKHLRSTRQ